MGQAMGCCYRREKAAAPPPEFCGVWCSNSTAIKLINPDGMEARALIGLPPPKCLSESTEFTYLVVSAESHRVQYCTGAYTDGTTPRLALASGQRTDREQFDDVLKEFDCDQWISNSKNDKRLMVTNKEYAEYEDEELLIAFTINAQRVERLCSMGLLVGEPPVEKDLSVIYKEFGNLRDTFLEAMWVELERVKEMQEPDTLKALKNNHDHSMRMSHSISAAAVCHKRTNSKEAIVCHQGKGSIKNFS